MEKRHFDDPTNIDCPMGMLDGDTLLRLQNWPHGWETFGGRGVWEPSPHPKWYVNVVYRARPAPLTQDVIPWHLLDDRLTVAVTDGIAAWAAEDAYLNASGRWWVVNGHSVRIDLIKGYQRGTVHWTDSLQQRPEGV